MTIVNTYFSGTTIQPVATFRDWSNELAAPGPIIDPTTVVVSTYFGDETIMQADVGPVVKETNGIYHYDWTLPLEQGNYFIEFIGTIGTEPSVVRHEVKVKFKI